MTIHLAPDGHTTGHLDARKVARFLPEPEQIVEQPDADVIDALKQIPQAEYPPELLAARRIAFLRQMERMNNGTDTSLSAKLDDAGYGSGGIL